MLSPQKISGQASDLVSVSINPGRRDDRDDRDDRRRGGGWTASGTAAPNSDGLQPKSFIEHMKSGKRCGRGVRDAGGGQGLHGLRQGLRHGWGKCMSRATFFRSVLSLSL